MEVKVLGSSSKGNCYLLTVNSETLVIEAGVSLAEVKQALNFDISRINAVCISHSHGDHSKYIGQFIEAGLTVLALPDVFEKWNINSHFAKTVQFGRGYRAGGFSVVPFEAKHDVPCAGFLINHINYGNILFLTDTFCSKYVFKDLRLIMVECNYSDEILDKNIAEGRLPYAMKKRLITSHIGLDTTIKFLKANNLSKTDAIILLHLSDGNSDEKYFVNQIRKNIGVPTYAADKNQIYNF